MSTSGAFQRPSPVALSSSCVVALNNSGSPNMAELSYPYRKAILIDEIRFDLSVQDNNVSQANLGSLIYVKFQLGQNYLMRDPVPVWLLGTLMDLTEEQTADTLTNPTTFVSHYRWRLPEPLYIEAGQVLRPVFSNPFASPTAPITIPATAITVQVTYCGRVVPPATPCPSTLLLPYVAVYTTTIAVNRTYQQSNEYHLFNPFNKPVKVQRLTGRLLSAESNPVAASGLTASPPTNAVNVLIDDSWGGKIVNNNTGPGDVFDALRAAWTFDTVMPPKGQYNVRVWNLPSAQQQLQIAMVGTREEAL